MASNVTRDHHNLRRNLKLNSNYISNDGGSDGINIADDGDVTLTSNDTQLKIAYDGSNYTTMTVQNDGDLTIKANGTGASAVLEADSTLHLNGSAMTIDVTTAIELDAGSGDVYITKGGLLSQLFAQWDADNYFYKQFYDGSNYLKIITLANGATTIETNDSDGAVGHLTLDADGFLKLDAHAYAETEGVQFLLAGTHVGNITGHHTATNLRLYENIGASTDDYFNIGVAANGSTIIKTEDAAGADGHIQFSADGHVKFDTCAVGFNKLAEQFSNDDITSSGGTDDTDIDFRTSNKISLAVTGNITNLNLIFPAVSGNFLLLLNYDGDHTITNYKVYEADESAADGDADVFWPGGTKPDNTASGVDILSFFYDATSGSDKCYGVASLAFATP